MRNIAVLGLEHSYAASLGAMLDAHAMLTELFVANDALGSYAAVQTQLEIVTEDGRPLTLAGGRTIAADVPFAGVRNPRLVYLPGFQLTPAKELAALLHRSARLHHWLRERAAEGAVIGANGAAVVHLVAAGLTGKETVSVPLRLVAEMRALFPTQRLAPPDTIIQHGKVVTCGDRAQCFALVSRLLADSLAESSLVWLNIRQGVVGEADGGGLSSDSLVARAQLMLRERFTANMPISDLADVLSVSHHTLIRRFKKATGMGPREYRQRARIETGAIMLRETGRSIAEIGLLVGYADQRSFREAFVRRFSETPSDYRRSHRASGPS